MVSDKDKKKAPPKTSTTVQQQPQQPPPQRTIQVKIGGQAAQTMTPDQAAEYLKTIASKAGVGIGVTTSTSGGSGSGTNSGGSGRRSGELKMTFTTTGGGSGSGGNNTTGSSASDRSGEASVGGIDVGINLNLNMGGSSSGAAAGVGVGATASSASATPAAGIPATGSKRRKDGMPCSEKEMKALMSMFVEIMGLQMNTEKLNAHPPPPPHVRNRQQSSTSNSSNSNNNQQQRCHELFTFPADLPPPPGGWPEDLLWPPLSSSSKKKNSDGNGGAEEEEEVDSLPDLEEVEKEDDYDEDDDDDDDDAEGDTAKQEDRKPAAKAKKHSNFNNSKICSTNHSSNAFFHYPISCMPHFPFPSTPPEPVTGTEGIAVLEWEALERVAIEDALEQEERARNKNTNNINFNNNKTTASSSTNSTGATGTTATNNNNINNNNNSNNNNQQQHLSKKKQQNETKRRRAVQAWKTKVLAAVQSSQANRLRLLLEEAATAPFLLKNCTDASQKAEHLESLVPQIVPKNNTFTVPTTSSNTSNTGSNNNCCKAILTTFLLEQAPQLLLQPTRQGRSAFHTACFYAQLELLQQIVNANLNNNNSNCNSTDNSSSSSKNNNAATLLDQTCLDSGWTPLQYAAVSGSLAAVELVLRHTHTGSSTTTTTTSSSCDCIRTLTNDTFTWQVSNNNKGLTVIELLDCILNENNSNNTTATADTDTDGTSSTTNTTTQMETTGMAVQELNKDLDADRLAMLAAIKTRLQQVEKDGHYVPLTAQQISAIEKRAKKDAAAAAAAAASQQGTKQQQATTTTTPAVVAATDPVPQIHESSSASTSSSIGSSGNNNEGGGRKKGKKKKNAKNANAAAAFGANATTAEPTAARSLPPPKPKTDPLVAALLSMGFERDQIMAGVQACGGLARATADDVVTWMVGHGEEDDENNDFSHGSNDQNDDDGDEEVLYVDGKPPPSEPLKSAPVAAVSSSSSVRSATSTSVASAATASAQHNHQQHRSRDEAAKHRAVEEEKAAQKREEQRRRNREWNNRAQVRQRQEAQAKLHKDLQKVSTTNCSISSGTSNAVAATTLVDPYQNRRGNAATAAAAASGNYLPPHSHLNKSSPSPRPDRRGFPAENVVTNTDASTIASSMDNDDATVSTLGSLPARATPVLMMGSGHQQQLFQQQQLYQYQQQQQQQQYYPHHPPKITQHVVPPGFGQASAVPAQQPSQMMDLRSISGGGVLPPGIPETEPLQMLEHTTGLGGGGLMGIPTVGFSAGNSVPNNSFGGIMRNVQDSLAGNQTVGGGLLGGPALNSSGFASGGVPLGFSQSLGYENSISPALTSSSVTSSSRSGGGPPLPAPHSFGLASSQSMQHHQQQQQQEHHHLDSSIIDSISTGNTAVLGTALWGDVPMGRTSTGSSSSSLLGNLIHTSNSNSRLDVANSIGHTPQSDNPFANSINQQQDDSLASVGLWGRKGSASLHPSEGSGSIW